MLENNTKRMKFKAESFKAAVSCKHKHSVSVSKTKALFCERVCYNESDYLLAEELFFGGITKRFLRLKIQTDTKENNMSSTSSADESVSKSVVLTCYQCLFLMNEICDNFRSSVSFKFCNNRMHLYRKCAKHSFRLFVEFCR